MQTAIMYVVITLLGAEAERLPMTTRRIRGARSHAVEAAFVLGSMVAEEVAPHSSRADERPGSDAGARP